MSIAHIINLRVGGRKITGADADRPVDIPIRAWRVIMKHGMATLGQYWLDNIVQKHFGTQAARNYPGVYKKRSVQYVMRKRGIHKSEIRSLLPYRLGRGRTIREVLAHRAEEQRVLEGVVASRGGDDYLHNSGNLLEATRAAVLKAFPSRVRISITGADYLKYQRHRSSPDMLTELTTVLPSEARKMESVAQQAINKSLKAFAADRSLPAMSGFSNL